MIFLLIYSPVSHCDSKTVTNSSVIHITLHRVEGPLAYSKLTTCLSPPKANLITCLPQLGPSKRPLPPTPSPEKLWNGCEWTPHFPLSKISWAQAAVFPEGFKFESVHISEWLLQVLVAAWRPVRSAREASSGGQLRWASSVWCEAARGRNARLARTTSESAGKQTTLSCFHH